ncbi:Six-hairpin glycosidase-like protein [Aspergillus pseudoustus]|uniref:Six-hairpin glycosidase-like protein n=1 Tax=Aspergillus pseudoustus TaxID=1810923 RepID=A0ABR4KXS2_9EURO
MPPAWTKTIPWVWTPDPSYKETDPSTPAQIVLFRKTFTIPSCLTSNPKILIIHVSADTRYRLYINGTSVSFGPAKSHLNEWNYETVDLAPFLRGPGERNVLAARVLRYSGVQVGNTSMVRGAIPGFVLFEEGEEIGLSTSTPWLCKVDKSVRILPASAWNRALGPPFLCVNETVDAALEERGWLLPDDADFDDGHWDTAVASTLAVPMLPVHDPWRLVPRSIPSLPEIEGRFSGVVKADSDSDCSLEAAAWTGLIRDDKPVTVQANSTARIILESEALVTAFIRFAFRGGPGAAVTIRCAECFEYPPADGNPNPFARNKGDRTDSSGILVGPDDCYTLPAATTDEAAYTYEPFWHRTFRYLQLTITTGASALIVTHASYRETHYPLRITTTLPLSTLPPLEAQKWATSLRTLRLCMQETYTDCPFYEQNQFALDTRLQALFSYNLSRDDRLARKSIQEFAASRRACDGLVETHFPAPFPGTNIPVFSLFWVLMVHDHMMYFGDEGLVRRHVGAVDGILTYFENRIDAEYGMVGRFESDAWAFVDWMSEWSTIPPGGSFTDLAVPPGYRRTGVISYVSLLYAFVLQRAAELCEFLGRRDTAAEYSERAARVNEAVVRHCLRSSDSENENENDEGKGDYLTDAPDSPSSSSKTTPELSQHTQIFAILSGAIRGTHARRILRRALNPSTNAPYARCSYAMSFYVFEAAVQTGLYDEFRAQLVAPWTAMLEEMKLSTWAESAAMSRSDCHGWSCVPVYDAVVNVLGVRPVKPGWGRLRFEPRRGVWDLSDEQEGEGRFEGVILVKRGEVRVFWDKKGKRVSLWVDFDVEVEIRDGEGYKVVQVKKGEVFTIDG